MRQLFSTNDVHPRDRYEYWHDVACRNIMMHDEVPESRLGFEAEMQIGSLAEIRLIRFKTSPRKFACTTCHAEQANHDELFVNLQLSGQAMLEQNSREVMLEAGDFTLLDPSLPHAGTPANLLLLKVPRLALEARLGKTSQIVAMCTKARDAEGGLTSSLLAMLPGYVDGLQPATSKVLSSQVLDMIALSLTHTMGAARPKVSSSQAVVSMKLRAAIESQLADPELDSDAVAAAAGISVRYSNQVLAREGTSITRFIQTRRLERCRRALHDPSQAHRTISEIAYGWGFNDLTHFGRSFRAAFGMLPSEFRNSAGPIEGLGAK
jgi:AraC family transcriptional regulator, positive regulator of tynA and feaB